MRTILYNSYFYTDLFKFLRRNSLLADYILTLIDPHLMEHNLGMIVDQCHLESIRQSR